MIPICLVCGPSESGKTTLMERLIRALAARGVEVATVKHHRGRIEMDRPGKDSWRHRRAGAKATFLVSDGEVAAFLDASPGLEPADLLPLCPAGTRLLLVEGFKGLPGHPRLEVVRKGHERDVAWGPDVLCVATNIPGFEAPCPVLSLDDGEGIADLLVRQLL